MNSLQQPIQNSVINHILVNSTAAYFDGRFCKIVMTVSIQHERPLFTANLNTSDEQPLRKRLRPTACESPTKRSFRMCIHDIHTRIPRFIFFVSSRFSSLWDLLTRVHNRRQIVGQLVRIQTRVSFRNSGVSSAVANQ